MAMITVHLELIRHIQDKLLAKGGARSLLSLGYPDALVGEPVMEKLFSPEQRQEIAYLPQDQADSILRWHGLSGVPVPDTLSIFKTMGWTSHIIDISPSRGIEEKIDLNEPLPQSLKDRFDLVLDLGTTEHCFNIGQAMKNVAESLRPGGVVLHSNPFGFYDHGFFNMTPSFYQDFYGQNGFTVPFIKILSGSPTNYQLMDIGPEWKKTAMPPKSILLVVAQRTKAQPIAWPMQSKYLNNPDLKG